MRNTKLLLLPLLLCLSSCISIGTTPAGSEFVPGSSLEEKHELEYFEGLGQNIEKTEPFKNISFRNENPKAVKEYNDSNASELLLDTVGDKDIISSYSNLKNVFYGTYGLKLNFQGGQENNLGINLKNSVRYIEIICSPSFVNSLNYESGEIVFNSADSAINVNNSKYVKLITEKQDDGKNKTYAATFDLGEEKTNLINIHCELYSTVIYEINLY